MNKADLFVKKQILTYFTVYQTRWQVLFHLFLSNGNGAYWKDGEPVFDNKDKNGMNDFINILEESMNDPILHPKIKEIKVAHEFHSAIKNIIENNIDVIASTMATTLFEPFLPQATYSDINNFVESGSKYCLIYDAYLFKQENPEWKVDEEWKTAILEVIRLVNHILFNTSFNYMSDTPIEDPSGWHNEKHFNIYYELLDIRYTLFPEDIEIEREKRLASKKAMAKLGFIK